MTNKQFNEFALICTDIEYENELINKAVGCINNLRKENQKYKIMELKIGDRVKNIRLEGVIVDIKVLDKIPGNPKAYLIKYPLFTFKNPFRRKLWTFGFNLERIED